MTAPAGAVDRPIEPPSGGAGATGFGPWNPGIESQVPEALQHLCTIFRAENVFTSVEKARELRDLTGLPLSELVAFRPRRLALHELLVRVTADFSVPDGPRIEDLGINFRRIVGHIQSVYLEPEAARIDAAAADVRHRLATAIAGALTIHDDATNRGVESAPKPFFARFLSRLTGRQTAPAAEATPGVERTRVAAWTRRAQATDDPLQRAALAALAKVANAMLVRHERIWGGTELLAEIANDLAWNDFGSTEIGRMIEPCLAAAATAEGYRRLPAQEHPVVINIKGPSASGKSTVRPLQRALAGEIGADPDDFAVISPDIWRKQLLDYGTLGDAYKYGGAFTADEIFIVDRKLDRYMAQKARRGAMSHLLIDRFRFDSFAHDSDEAGSNLLTRFGQEIYLTFIITPPESLVVRAWNRGLEVGRYKAVDDTLAHAVEAYSGMPQLFFTWVERADKRMHFEFLDNSVRQGELPRTVAFGRNDELNVLDVKCLLDVERYRRVDVDATTPGTLYPDPRLLAPAQNTAFLRQCVDRFPAVNFADQATGRVYARLEAGVPAFVDPGALAAAAADPDTEAGLRVVAPALFASPPPCRGAPPGLADAEVRARAHTLGSWGGAARR
jgi:hypothetical protein